MRRKLFMQVIGSFDREGEVLIAASHDVFREELKTLSMLT